ncbi:MAG: hypothetical protein IJS14_04050 [Lentisphaeria bacterium]|nr:hypothetical protein [Lentisphaeria bacterium]
MNESLENRLDNLAIELAKRRRQYRASLRNLIYLAVVTLVFFSLYAGILSYKIREIATPSTVALLIADQLREQFLGELKKERVNIRQTASDMAQAALLALPVTIHAAGDLVRRSMEQDADNAVLDLSDALTPLLHDSVARIVSDRDISAGTIGGMAERIVNGKEFRRAESDARTLMFPVPLSFGERLREIRKKNGSMLTRKELCDRDFMLCWLFLEEEKRYRDTRYAAHLMALSSLVFDSWGESVSGAGSAPGQNSTNSSPAQKSAPAIP